MPLWQIFHHPDAFNQEEKQAFSKAITKHYHDLIGLPAFYVIVAFEPNDSIFVGGEPDKKFVRIVMTHIARERGVVDEKAAHATQDRFAVFLKTHIEDRGMTYEYHYDYSPRLFWRVNGLIPPPGGSEEEAKWRAENKPVPYY